MDAKRKLIKLKVRVVMTENEFQKTKEQLERISRILRTYCMTRRNCANILQIKRPSRSDMRGMC